MLYKVQYRYKYSAARNAETSYYEDKDKLAADLVVMSLDIAKQDKYGSALRILSRWRKQLSDEERTVTDIIGVWKIVDDEWQPVKYSFTPPWVEVE